MDNPEDDEWEYEYDENETEEFYVTLDLSGILPAGHESIDPAYIPSIERQRKLGRRSYKKTLSRTHAESAEQPVDPNVDADNTDTIDSSRIQILDLHTSNPLIGYRGQLLSCHWASTVGTDMLFARSEPESESQHTPLRTLPSFDLLGLSSTKLMASTAQLRPRDNLPVIEAEPSPFPDQATRRRSSGTINADSANLLPSTSKAKINQMNFLSRLNAANAKRKRGSDSTTSLPTRSGEDTVMTEGDPVENTSTPDPHTSIIANEEEGRT